MTQLESVFYIVAIFYMLVGLALFAGVGIAVFVLLRSIFDLKNNIKKKIDYVDSIIKNPKEKIAELAGFSAKSFVGALFTLWAKKYKKE